MKKCKQNPWNHPEDDDFMIFIHVLSFGWVENHRFFLRENYTQKKRCKTCFFCREKNGGSWIHSPVTALALFEQLIKFSLVPSSTQRVMFSGLVFGSLSPQVWYGEKSVIIYRDKGVGEGLFFSSVLVMSRSSSFSSFPEDTLGTEKGRMVCLFTREQGPSPPWHCRPIMIIIET